MTQVAFCNKIKRKVIPVLASSIKCIIRSRQGIDEYHRGEIKEIFERNEEKRIEYLAELAYFKREICYPSYSEQIQLRIICVSGDSAGI